MPDLPPSLCSQLGVVDLGVVKALVVLRGCIVLGLAVSDDVYSLQSGHLKLASTGSCNLREKHETPERLGTSL